MHVQTSGSYSAELFSHIWDSLVRPGMARVINTYARSISDIMGCTIEPHIYQGVGLNECSSFYCSFESSSMPFRLYLEITTDSRQGLDMFIIDFSIPKELRGLGIGTDLARLLLDSSAGLKIRQVTLNPVSKRAERFWAGVGFEKVNNRGLMAYQVREHSLKLVV
ncbi:MAG: hypothetical protein M1130_07875 [Actinobacteria bacterium]|nr:hypothetical protein [Actinomycetota bacterium]